MSKSLMEEIASLSQIVVPDTSTLAKAPANKVTLLTIAATFLRLGATTYGGMWAATRQIEKELVERRGWIGQEEMLFFLVAATIVPAPKFMGLGGLIGYRLRGLAGSTVAVLSLIVPGSLMVLAVVLLVPPSLLAEHLAPVQRSVGVAVVGIIFGSACRQVRTAKVTGSMRVVGIALGLAVGTAVATGVPLLLSLALGVTVGAILIKGS